MILRNGATVYGIDGRQFQYVSKSGDGHIVRPIFEVDDSDALGNPELQDRVFAKPPAPRYAAETDKALRELEQARAELRKAEEQTETLKQERAALLQQFARHPVLEPIADWMAGKITHAAALKSYGSSIEIKTIEELIAPGERDRTGEVRLLALYGSKKWEGGLRWQLNAYYDGSGDNVTCILGTSKEDVLDRVQVHLDKELSFASISDYSAISRADSAMRLGLRVPEKFVEAVQQRRAKDAAENAKRKRDQLARAEAQLEVARAEVAAIEVMPQ